MANQLYLRCKLVCASCEHAPEIARTHPEYIEGGVASETRRDCRHIGRQLLVQAAIRGEGVCIADVVVAQLHPSRPATYGLDNDFRLGGATEQPSIQLTKKPDSDGMITVPLTGPRDHIILAMDSGFGDRPISTL